MTMTARVTGGGGKGGQRVSKSPSISSAHRNHKGEKGGGGKECGEDSRNEGGWAGVSVWMMERAPSVTTRAIYRGTIAEFGLIDEAAGLWLYS